MAFKLAVLFQVAIEDIFIYEVPQTMPTLADRVRTFWGFKFGFERLNQEAIQAIAIARRHAGQSDDMGIGTVGQSAASKIGPAICASHDDR